MSQVVFHQGLDLRPTSLPIQRPSQISASLIVANSSVATYEFTGHFETSNAIPTGTLTEFQSSVGGTVFLTATDLSADAATVFDALWTQNDTDLALSIALAEDDTITGSSADDGIVGYGGADYIDANHGDDTVVAGAGDDTVLGNTGDDLLFGEDGNDSLSGGSGDDSLWGEAGDDTLSGGDGGDQIIGDGGNDTLFGSEGDDFLLGGLGNDLLIGGAGTDFLDGNEGDDELHGGEFKDYDDDIGFVYRLYQSTLNREPDVAGAIAWAQRVSDGQSLANVAQGFVSSAEFQNTYGTLDDTAFVSLMYENVLGRAADAEGLNGWLAQLQAGSSRQSVVLGFSESQEFKSATEQAAAAFRFSDLKRDITDDIFRLYQATLNRTADAAGLESWADNYANGMTYDQIVAGFMDSQEFQNLYGGLDDTLFVETLYTNVLGRAADTTELAGWLDQMSAGMTRVDVVKGFAQSTEFVQSTYAALVQFLQADTGSFDAMLAKTDDILGGLEGSDTVYGGFGSDAFVFFNGVETDPTAMDVVKDFEPWDTIAFIDFNYSSKSESLSHFSQNGSSVIFDNQLTVVEFENTQISWITEAMIYLE